MLGFSLKGKMKNVRRDFSNGYVIAEVLHHYYPKDIELPEFRNGDSLPTKDFISYTLHNIHPFLEKDILEDFFLNLLKSLNRLLICK